MDYYYFNRFIRYNLLPPLFHIFKLFFVILNLVKKSHKTHNKRPALNSIFYNTNATTFKIIRFSFQLFIVA